MFYYYRYLKKKILGIVFIIFCLFYNCYLEICMRICIFVDFFLLNVGFFFVNEEMYMKKVFFDWVKFVNYILML